MEAIKVYKQVGQKDFKIQLTDPIHAIEKANGCDYREKQGS